MSIPVKIGIIGGSGLDNPDILRERTEKKVTTVFGDPSDALIEGTINNVPCVILARHGRKHNISPTNINYRANIWALKEVGCTHILASAAVGSLQEDYEPGDIVVLNNFIDRTHKRNCTFFDGQPTSLPGVRHVPMEPPFCERTRKIVIDVIRSLGFKHHDTGTIVVIEGPRFSTKAESELYRQWNGHVIGMTTCPEVILAKEAGLCYSVISLVTDYDCWRPIGPKVNVKDVEATFKKNVANIVQVITNTISKIASEDWHNTIQEMKNMVESADMEKR